MGFFDSMLKVSKPEIKSEKEAYAAIIYASMAIDGEISEEEVHDLIEMVAHDKMFKGSNINDIFKTIAANYKAAGSFEFRSILGTARLKRPLSTPMSRTK